MIKPILKFEDLIIRCVENEQKANEELYKLFYGRFKSIAVRYVSDHYSAGDVVNFSFVKIFKDINSFDLPEDAEQQFKLFYAWAGKIVSKTSIDYIRVHIKDIYADFPTEVAQHLVQLNVVSRLLPADILKLFDELPTLQRIVFNMFELDGFSHQEIAEELAISHDHSRVILARARTLLHALYQRRSISVGGGMQSF